MGPYSILKHGGKTRTGAYRGFKSVASGLNADQVRTKLMKLKSLAAYTVYAHGKMTYPGLGAESWLSHNNYQRGNPAPLSLHQLDAALRRVGKTVQVKISGAGAATVKRLLSMTPGGRRKAKAAKIVRRVLGNPSDAFNVGLRAGKGGNWRTLPPVSAISDYGIDNSNYAEFKAGFRAGNKTKRKR